MWNWRQQLGPLICLLEKAIPIAANPPGPPDMNYGGLVQNNGYMGYPEVNSSNGNVLRQSEDLVNRSNNELIRGIHKQMTSFVLKKVSQQILALENLDNLLQNQQELNQSTPIILNINRDVNSKIPAYEPNFNPQQMTNILTQVLTHYKGLILTRQFFIDVIFFIGTTRMRKNLMCAM